MPLVTETETGPIQQLPEIPDEAVESPGIGEIFGAAFRVENSLVSMATNALSFNSTDTEAGFDPFDGENIKGYEMFAPSFITIKSSQEMASKKTQIDNELVDRQTLSAGGVTSLVAQVVAGGTDPMYWPLLMIPGGAAIRTSKSIAQASMRLGAIGAISEIPAEAAKQLSQETRTQEDALFAIGGSAVLSGLLGAAVKSLSKAEINSLSAKLDDVMGKDDTPMVFGNAIDSTDPKSIGAAETPQLTIEELAPVKIFGIEKMGVSPLIRAENTSAVAPRRLAAEMMESATVKQANIDGKSTAPEGGSAETRIKLWSGGLYQSLKDIDDFYTAYRGGKGATTRIVNDYIMRNRAGKLTQKQFREEVGKVARRGDTSSIPEVQQAAESFRKNVFDPMKDGAIREGLLPPGVEVQTATSYLTRVYNVEKIGARRDQWDSIVQSWVRKGRDDAKLLDKPSETQISEAAIKDTEIASIADDITNNIMGVASGRTPYEVVAGVRGPLKERTFNIPDQLIEDFLESDIDIIARQYVRTMAPDIELSRLYGTPDMKEQIEEIIPKSYKELINKAKTEKERTRLQAEMKTAQDDISAMRDRLRGTYRTPENPNGFFVRAGRVLRDVNFVRMLGGMTLSAIPDLARPVAVNGLRPVARGMMALATNYPRFKVAKAEARRSAVGLDMVLNGRAASMAELTDIYSRSTAFERGLRITSDAFGKLTLMSQWNTALKSFSGVVTQDRILAAVSKVADGTASKSTITRLASSGIGKTQAQAIARQFKKFGDEGSLNLSNGHLWDDKNTLETFQAAVLKDVDRTIITPGEGEKPLWTSSEHGKLIFQFKTFASAAHHKILVSDLQYRDANALNGFLLSVAFGSAAYGAKQYVAGREISTDPSKLIVESLDRSGGFGYFWDVNNTVEKLSRGEVGVSKLVGSPPMSRYVSRNWLGALLGPSMGTVQDIGTVTGALSSGEFSESDLRKVRKLMPGQNLFYMRKLLDTLEEDIGQSL